MTETSQILRRLPSVDRVMQSPAVESLLNLYGRPVVVEAVQQCLSSLRHAIQEGSLDPKALSRRLEELEAEVDRWVASRLSPSLRRVVNATGVILFTNAGRAPLAMEVSRRVAETASGYNNLELDLQSGSRGHRDQHVETRLTRLLDCEAATVCNNNAAALFLILNTLAARRRVLVSRGELIEIGGSFRLPAIMEKSGAVLVEVGTTNKTRLADYRHALGEETALILKVHPSNYRITGFTESAGLEELSELARAGGVPLVFDAGSGLLFPSPHAFLRNEPAVSSALTAGADLVLFSGDKLLGGPQAGIIAGRKNLIDRVRGNPLMRACRAGKMTCAALEGTLLEYEKGTFEQSLPVWRMLSVPAAEIRNRAEPLRQRLQASGVDVELRDGNSLAGGGSAPEEHIPTCLLAVTSSKLSAGRLEESLRNAKVPILTRIEEDRLLIDLRTVLPEEDTLIADAFESLFAPSDPR